VVLLLIQKKCHEGHTDLECKLACKKSQGLNDRSQLVGVEGLKQTFEGENQIIRFGRGSLRCEFTKRKRRFVAPLEVYVNQSYTSLNISLSFLNRKEKNEG